MKTKFSQSSKTLLALLLAVGLLLITNSVARAANKACNAQGQPFIYWNLGAAYANTEWEVFVDNVKVGTVTLNEKGEGSVIVGEAGISYTVEFRSEATGGKKIMVGGDGILYCPNPSGSTEITTENESQLWCDWNGIFGLIINAGIGVANFHTNFEPAEATVTIEGWGTFTESEIARITETYYAFLMKVTAPHILPFEPTSDLYQGEYSGDLIVYDDDSNKIKCDVTNKADSSNTDPDPPLIIPDDPFLQTELAAGGS